MAKIYDQKQRNEPGREPVQTQKRSMVILVAIILGLIIVLMLYRMASSEEIDLAGMMTRAPVISTLYNG